MTKHNTPTEEEIAKAKDIVENWNNSGVFVPLVLSEQLQFTADIAQALADARPQVIDESDLESIAEKTHSYFETETRWEEFWYVKGFKEGSRYGSSKLIASLMPSDDVMRMNAKSIATNDGEDEIVEDEYFGFLEGARWLRDRILKAGEK